MSHVVPRAAAVGARGGVLEVGGVGGRGGVAALPRHGPRTRRARRGLGRRAQLQREHCRHECAPNLCAAQTVDVEIEGKVEQLEVVCDGPEGLKPEMLVEVGGDEDGEDGGGRGAEHEQQHDGDQDEDQHPLLRALQRLPPRGPGHLPLQQRLLLQQRFTGILKIKIDNNVFPRYLLVSELVSPGPAVL